MKKKPAELKKLIVKKPNPLLKHADEKEDKSMIKKMIKKSALK